MLGCWFLNLEEDQVFVLSQVPDRLQECGLPMARWALLFALGKREIILEEWQERANEDSHVTEFFTQWKQQPASEGLPSKLSVEDGQEVEYSTVLMGVTYRCKAVNEFGPVAFSENLLGVIEAALATANWESLAFVVEEVAIEIDEDSQGTTPPPFVLPPAPERQVFRLTWQPDMARWLVESSRAEVTDYLKKGLLTIVASATIDPMDDLRNELASWHKEDTFSRAIGASPTIIQLADLFESHRNRTADADEAAAT